MSTTMSLRLFGAAALALALFAATPRPHATPVRHKATVPAAATSAPIPTMSPEALLAAIRNRFRSHRPPPPYETYTYQSKGNTNYGEPDYAGNLTMNVWYRSSDHAAFTRRTTELGFVGDPDFKRTLFNAAIEPGPPTADVFEPSPLHTHSPNFVPTPEPTNEPKILVTVRVRGEFDYRVASVTSEGSDLHLKLEPRRDPMRNRLRELWVDAKTLELHKLVATDILFIIGTKDQYPMLFTYYFSTLAGMPVITHLHGVVYGGYDGDEQTVDIDFKDVVFPLKLPDWYFDPHTWGQHKSEWPEPPELTPAGGTRT